MNAFNENMIVGNEKLNFSFTLIITPKGRKYFVTASNQKGNVANFDIAPDKWGKWKIINPAPMWAMSMEKELLGAIKRHS